MIQLTETISFNEEEPLLSKQNQDFQSWYSENFHSKIVEPLNPTGYDQYHRPISFVNEYNNISIETEFIYIYENSNSWACSDFKLTILNN